MTDTEALARVLDDALCDDVCRDRDPRACTCSAAAAALRAAGARAVMLKAAAEGAGSLLLDVQRDCIAERARAERAEKALRRAKAATVDELGREDLRRRAKAMLKRNGWRPGAKFSSHSTVELMVALAIDATLSPPDHCGWPECGCCHDASCDSAFTIPETPHG